MNKKQINISEEFNISAKTKIEELLNTSSIKKSVEKIIKGDELLSSIDDYKEQVNLILSDEDKLKELMQVLSDNFVNLTPQFRLLVGEIFQFMKDSILNGEKYGLDLFEDTLGREMREIVGDNEVKNNDIEHFSLGLPYYVKYDGEDLKISKVNKNIWEHNGKIYYLVDLSTMDDKPIKDKIYISSENDVLTLEGFELPISQINNIKGHKNLLEIELFKLDYCFVADLELKPIKVRNELLQKIEGKVIFNGKSYFNMTFLNEATGKQLSYYCSEDFEELKIKGFNETVTSIVNQSVAWLGLVYQITFTDGEKILTKSNGEVYKVDGELVQGFKEFDVHEKLGDEDGKIGNTYLYTIYFKSGKTYIVDENMTILRDSNIFNILTGEKIQNTNEPEKYDLSNVQMISDDVELDLEGDDIIYSGLKFTKFGDDLLVEYYKGVFTGNGKKIGDPYDTIGGFHTILDEKFLVIDKAEGGQVLLNNEYKILSYKGGVVSSIVYGEGLDEFAIVEAGDEQIGIKKKGFIKIEHNDGQIDTVAIKELHFM